MENKKKFGEWLKWFGQSLIWLVPLVIVIDLATKLIFKAVNANFPIIPGFFYISVIGNTGAAWSLFEDHPEILAVLSVICSGLIIWYAVKKYNKLKKIIRVCIYLALAGCMGNMIDRCFQFVPGTAYHNFGVIDFLSFHFGSYVFPTFNIADSSLVIGIGMLLVVFIIDEIKLYRAKQESEDLKIRINKKIQDYQDEKEVNGYKDIINDIDTALHTENLDTILEENVKAKTSLGEEFQDGRK